VAAYAYPAEEDPFGAFSWWLSPCGGDDLVPDEIKAAFGVLSNIADGMSSFTKPKNVPKGSGKKGNAANPTDRSKPKAGTGSGVNGQGTAGVQKRKKCTIKPGEDEYILGTYRNTLRTQAYVPDRAGVLTLTRHESIITSLAFGPRPTTIHGVCKREHEQACYHYSSAILQQTTWAEIRCPHGQAIGPEKPRPAPDLWYKQHHDDWLNEADRA